MKQNYYTFDRAQLLNSPKISITVLEDNQIVFQAIASEMVEEIQNNNRQNKKTVFIVPVGPVGQYPYFVSMVNEMGIDLKNVWFINMDEYLDDNKMWINTEDKLSFRGFMEREVYSKIDQKLVMPQEQRIFPDPLSIDYIPGLIEELGGVDIAFGGIGINGHVAFNEPQEELSAEEFLQLKTRVREIATETRAVNSVGDLNGALDEMPHYCVTIGMYEISRAKKIRLGCFRDWHRAVVRHAAFGEKSVSFPVTLLQDHPDINIRITEFVAKLP